MATIEIYLPEEIKDYAPDLHYFFSTMVRKLHTNRHKGTGHIDTPDVMAERAQEELKEVWQALINEGQFETAVECVDVSNFMFLAARACWNMTRSQFKEIKYPPDTIYKYKSMARQSKTTEGEASGHK